MGSDWIYFLTFPIFLWLKTPLMIPQLALIDDYFDILLHDYFDISKNWRIHEYTDMHSAVPIFSP